MLYEHSILLKFHRLFVYTIQFCHTSINTVSDLCMPVHTVRLAPSLAHQERELAARTGPRNLLLANGRVVNDGRCVDVIDGALARLVVGAKSPRIDLAAARHGKAVVGTCSYRHNIGRFYNVSYCCYAYRGSLTRKSCRLDQDTSASPLVKDNLLVVHARKLVQLDTNLVTVHTAPSEQLALTRAG